MRFQSQAHYLTREKFLSTEEAEHFEFSMRRFLKAARDEKTERDLIALLLLYRTGARPEELLRATAKDFNFYERSIFIKGVKGSMDREIPLPDWLANHVHSFILRNSIKNHLFKEYGYHWLRKIWKEYRPCKKVLYCLRHTFAIKVYESTSDIRLVKTALGHKSIINTMIYLDYAYAKREMKRVIF